ncbi:MAG: ECF transporter S component [Candidatus Bathyarchaeota archaeon]|nr:ECF transporter S component [Candidatus Bathyarchaeota archaeon]
MKSRKIAAISTLTALSIGSNYAMIPLSNIKLMDLIVFVGGFCFGPLAGVLIGIFSWTIYGLLNPRGFLLPIWLATMFSEAIYGVVGGLIRRGVDPQELKAFRHWRVNTGIFFGVLGVFLTFIYDLMTNIVFGLVQNMNVLFAVVFGFATLGLIHMVSNAFFFGIGCIPMITAITKITGGETCEASEE